MINCKQELRNRLRVEYKKLSPEVRKKLDSRLVRNIMGNDLYRSSTRIFLYASIGSEIDTHHLIQSAFDDGKVVALPKSAPDGVMDFYCYTGKLVEGMFHIPEPTGNKVLYPEASDLMIVPGLAFDKRGHRIGQGAGYYDRYLSKYNCISIGVCREQFFMKEIPSTWNDIPVDYVITEKGIYNCKKTEPQMKPRCLDQQQLLQEL